MLLEKEMILFSDNQPSDIVVDDEVINEKYVKGEVRIVTEQARYPLNTIPALINSPAYELNPDFQRRRRWNAEKKSRLIESFIMNVPIPPIFLYENELSHYEVMDGLQRLSTICDFYEDKFELQGLQLWSELNGRKYSTLPDKIRKGIDRRYISSIILLQESARSDEEAMHMKQLVFERINSGGVSLEPQETRNALYDGKMNHLCLKLSRNRFLCRFLQIPEGTGTDVQEKLDSIELYRKMSDVEFVLRFFAMRQLEGYAKRKLHPFLDFYLDKANAFDEETLSKLGDIFEETIEFAYSFLGEYAFRMYKSRKMTDGNKEFAWTGKIVTTVYDPMMQVLSNLIPQKDKFLALSQKDVISKLECLYQTNLDSFDGRNNGKNDIERRIEIFMRFFNSLLVE